MAQFDGVEIPEEMLETISGGVLDDTSRDNLKGIVALFKRNQMSLESTLKALDYLHRSDDWNEIHDLIIEFYNAL